MKQEVEVVLRMLLKADSTIPPGGRIDRAIDIINGTKRDNQPPYITFKEAMDALHVDRATVKALFKIGKLNRVVGAHGRSLGVSRESFQRYLRGKMIGEE